MSGCSEAGAGTARFYMGKVLAIRADLLYYQGIPCCVQ